MNRGIREELIQIKRGREKKKREGSVTYEGFLES